MSAPFTITSNYISQAVQTTAVTNGGRASYSFTITNAGNYVIQALVNAPDDAANSFYINIDAEPQDPTMIWDIPLTAGFEQRVVSWRGNGTDANNQFVPKIFTLTQGSHQLIIRGRGANVQLETLAVLKCRRPGSRASALRRFLEKNLLIDERCEFPDALYRTQEKP